jgi:hypothetical protein
VNLNVIKWLHTHGIDTDTLNEEALMKAEELGVEGLEKLMKSGPVGINNLITSSNKISWEQGLQNELNTINPPEKPVKAEEGSDEWLDDKLNSVFGS